MQIPKFLMADHTDFPDSVFVVHTEFPRFIIDLKDDEISWQEDLGEISEQELADEVAILIEEASRFYDAQIALYEKE
jgi:hypothetical protein